MENSLWEIGLEPSPQAIYTFLLCLLIHFQLVKTANIHTGGPKPVELKKYFLWDFFETCPKIISCETSLKVVPKLFPAGFLGNLSQNYSVDDIWYMASQRVSFYP